MSLSKKETSRESQNGSTPNCCYFHVFFLLNLWLERSCKTLLSYVVGNYKKRTKKQENEKKKENYYNNDKIPPSPKTVFVFRNTSFFFFRFLMNFMYKL